MMNWCFKCGVSGDKARLFSVVSEKGILKACESCISQENLPIIKTASDFSPEKRIPEPKLPRNLDVKMGEDSKAMYKRLARLSGVKLSEKKESEETIKQNQVLKELVNKNFETELTKEKGDTSDLIENFHWIIMRARRHRKITQEQLAMEIEEPEVAIKMIEQGILSKDSSSLVKKIENHLGIILSKTKPLPQQQTEQEPQANLHFDVESMNTEEIDLSSENLTISDLQEMKKRKEEKKFTIFKKNQQNKEEEEFNVEKELSDEEMDDLFFGE